MPSDTTGVAALAAPTKNISTADTTPDSSVAVSPSEEYNDMMQSTEGRLAVRPKLGSRKTSGSLIVDRNEATIDDEKFDEGDVRAMSPRRSSTEVQKLSDDARKDLMEQAKILQTSLQAIVERVETVRQEHERLEGGNKFLQNYIGELMQTSRITSTAPLRSKGKGRSAK